MTNSGNLDALLVDATTHPIVVQTMGGDRTAFVLGLFYRNREGEELEYTVVAPPDKLQALCALLQDTLLAHGYPVPEPRSSGGGPQQH